MIESPLLRSLRQAVPTISVGMMTADLLNLGSEIALLETSGAQLVHFDVMDGCFCPMLTIGPPIVKAVKTPLLKDVHLMITDPLAMLADFVKAGADIVSVHLEADRYIHRVLQELGGMQNANDAERGLVRGLVVNPGTPVEAVEPMLDEVELVMLLAVNPGWSGQRLGAQTPRRLERLRRLVEDSGNDILVGIDGGITRENIGEVAKLGPDLMVAGSAVFDGKDPVGNAKYMLEAVAAATA
jgi:ribulose-phosphate 3-epimerase